MNEDLERRIGLNEAVFHYDVIRKHAGQLAQVAEETDPRS